MKSLSIRSLITNTCGMVALTSAFLFSPTVFAAFPANVDNTATVAPPAGVTDPDSSNDSATDSNLLAVGSISGTITEDTTGDSAGDTLLPATVELFADTNGDGLPDGPALDTVVSTDGNYTFAEVPAGDYVVIETDPSGYSSISDTQSADGDTVANTDTNDNSIPVTVTGAENDTGNDFVDTNLADLAITKDDGVTSYTPGSPVTYTITVTNSGPNQADGATVTDTFPAEITSASWTCVATGAASCTATGSGNISDTLTSFPAGESVTYTVVAQTDPDATGDLVNTATTTVPAGMVDPTPANNTATDTDTAQPQADLFISKDDSATNYTPGTSSTYVLVVGNNGPSNVTGATVADSLPAGVTLSGPVTCVATGAASCTASSGTTGDTSFSDAAVNIDSDPTGTVNFVTYTVPVTYSSDMADY